jgi:hypothetical protein
MIDFEKLLELFEKYRDKDGDGGEKEEEDIKDNA